MSKDVVTRIAFALQDDGMTRLRAQRLARVAVSALQVGDRLGTDLLVVQAAPPEVVVADPGRIVLFDPERRPDQSGWKPGEVGAPSS